MNKFENRNFRSLVLMISVHSGNYTRIPYSYNKNVIVNNKTISIHYNNIAYYI